MVGVAPGGDTSQCSAARRGTCDGKRVEPAHATVSRGWLDHRTNNAPGGADGTTAASETAEYQGGLCVICLHFTAALS